MMTSRCLLILAVALGALHAVYAQRGHKCSGMGKRFCNGANFDHEKCPSICHKSKCGRVDEDDLEIKSNGVKKYKRGYSWNDVVSEGVFDNTYIHDDFICYGVCWYKPWESKCDIWGETENGDKYCKLLNCEHDKGSRANEGDRYAGCHYSRSPDHRDTNGRKEPFHKPSCYECYHVFPACQKSLKGELSAKEREEIDLPRGTRDAHWKWDDKKYGNTRLYRRKRRNKNKNKNKSKDNDSSSKDGDKRRLLQVDSEESDNDGYEWEDYQTDHQTPAEWQVMFEDEVSPESGSAVQVASVILQLAAHEADVVPEKVTSAFAYVAGVNVSNVIILHMVSPEVIGYEPTEDLLTVNIGIVASDPEAVMYDIDTMDDDELMDILEEEAGLEYLSYSKSVDLKHISEAMLNPESSKSAQIIDQTTFGEYLRDAVSQSPMFNAVSSSSEPVSAEKSSCTMMMVLAGAVGALVTMIVGGAAYLVFRRRTPASPASTEELKSVKPGL